MDLSNCIVATLNWTSRITFSGFSGMVFIDNVHTNEKTIFGQIFFIIFYCDFILQNLARCVEEIESHHLGWMQCFWKDGMFSKLRGLYAKVAMFKVKIAEFITSWWSVLLFVYHCLRCQIRHVAVLPLLPFEIWGWGNYYCEHWIKCPCFCVLHRSGGLMSCRFERKPLWCFS